MVWFSLDGGRTFVTCRMTADEFLVMTEFFGPAALTARAGECGSVESCRVVWDVL